MNNLKLETRRTLKSLGLHSCINAHGEYYNCKDVATFFESTIAELTTLRQRLSDAEVSRSSLEERFKAAEEALRFYADQKNWHQMMTAPITAHATRPQISSSDLCDLKISDSSYLTNGVGGKRARDYFKNHAGIRVKE